GNHLRLSIRRSSQAPLTGIAFGQGHYLDIVKSRAFDLCYTLEQNHWRGQTQLQVNVKDIRPA
ncbi:MAG: single-stranded-DNA-specific exonuclease RecJ, partial [Bacteroidota bacterium]